MTGRVSEPQEAPPCHSGDAGELRAFVDESSSVRGENRREYLIGAAVLSVADCDDVRDQLRPLLLPGQKKLHWTDESEKRRRTIVDALIGLGSMNFVVSQVSERDNRQERSRRKCMEVLYHQLCAEEVFHVTLENRTESQDRKDVAHIVALQGQGLDRRIRIQHARGGDEPLLWIADAILGTVNSHRLGEPAHFDRLRETVVFDGVTPDSLPFDS